MLLKLLILVVACSIITWSPTWSKEPCFPLDQYNWLFCPNQLEDGKGIRSLLSNLNFQLRSHFNLFGDLKVLNVLRSLWSKLLTLVEASHKGI